MRPEIVFFDESVTKWSPSADKLTWQQAIIGTSLKNSLGQRYDCEDVYVIHNQDNPLLEVTTGYDHFIAKPLITVREEDIEWVTLNQLSSCSQFVNIVDFVDWTERPILPNLNYGQYGFMLLEQLPLALEQRHPHRINLSQLSLEQFSDLIGQLTYALTKAHHEKILVRDLSQANVMFRNKAVPVLIDLGEVAFLNVDQRCINTTTTGTPGYAAPEQYIPGSILTPATDVHALAALTHHLFTGASIHYSEFDNLLFLRSGAHITFNQRYRFVQELLQRKLVTKIESYLRKGVSENPDNRPHTPMDFFAGFQEVLQT